MDQLGTFQLNDARRLFELAKALHQKRFFNHHLTAEQCHIMNAILERDNFQLWRQFLDGNCCLVIAKDSSDDESTDSIPEGPEPVTQLALRIRYLLWEKAINFYYDKTSRENSGSLATIEELPKEHEMIELLDQLPEESNEESVPQEKTNVRNEEDDYDDDEDEENGEDKSKTSNGQEATDLKLNDNGQVILEMEGSVFAKSSEPDSEQEEERTQEPGTQEINAAESLEEQEATIKSFNKVYHNFEYDRETLIKKRKLDKSDMQLENQKTTENTESGEIPINLGLVSHSLKHLLNTIQERRDDISLNDLELRTLFMDVRKNRGKWANDERVGQEELYDACEKVLLDLRGYTEHSTPFLNKVSKREAPNYGLIIKKPMDLNTVMKKLKGLAYNSKQEFVDDLMLIWNNCLTYNSNPKHYLRAHALAMQKRTQKLVPSIPNIVIRNRSELEKDDEAEDGRASTPGGGGKKSSKKGRMRKREEVIKSEEPEGVADGSVESTLAQNTPTASVEPVSPVAEEKPSVAPEEREEDEEDEDAETEMRDNDEEDEDQDPELLAWKNLTATSRANYCENRAALFDDHYHLKMDAEALVRESGKMKNFHQFLEFKEVVSKGNKLLDSDEPYLLEYDIVGGVPGLAYEGVDDDAQEKYENSMADAIVQNPETTAVARSSLVLPEDSGLNKLYRDNITEIQEIRKICFKISLIRQMQTQAFVHRTQMRQPEIEYVKEVDVDPVSRLPNHDIFSEKTQYAALRKGVAKVAMHTGFESTEPFAINTLTQVAETYILNLAKTLKSHCESSSSNKLSEREILLLSLLENGVEKPDDLYTFIEERALKHQKKLRDLHDKLSGFLKDLLRPSLESFNEKNFEDNSEQFTTGDFTSDLGDDFFGFKELGLDKEFKMLTSSIPINLLHARLQSSLASSDSTSKSTKYEDLHEWNTPKLTAADVEKQIGLLRPFYRDWVKKTEAHYVKQQKRNGESTELPPPQELYLLEDDDLPQKQRNTRPRLPPTGKIASVKKKLLLGAFILPDEEENADIKLETGDPGLMVS